MKLIGKKDNFAIEFEIIDKTNLTGYAKIWMSNRFLGTNEDLIFLRGYLLDGLKEILNSKKIDTCVYKTFANYKFKNLFYYLKYNLASDDENINTYCYCINLGTFTDDYNVFSFSYNEDIYIVWKIINNNSNFKDIIEDKKGIHFFRIKKNELEFIIKELEKDLINLS